MHLERRWCEVVSITSVELLDEEVANNGAGLFREGVLKMSSALSRVGGAQREEEGPLLRSVE